MASNDSGAGGAAAAVNVVTPILPQPESKVPEAAQANHTPQPNTTSQITAVVPVSEAPVSVKEAQSEPSASSNDVSPSNIPTTNANAPEKTLTVSQPIPNEDTHISLKTTTSTTDNTNTTDDKSVVDNNKEQKAVSQEDKSNADQTKSQAEEIKNENDKKSDESTPIKNDNKETNASSSNAELSPTVSESDKSHNGVRTPPTEAISNIKPISAPSKPVATIKPMVDSTITTSSDSSSALSMDTSSSKSNSSNNPKSNNNNNKRPATDDGGDESDKRMKSSSTPSGSGGNKECNKSAEQVLEYMEKTFDQRRKIITKQMPTIPELKSMYPELFMGKQLLLEFQRITKIDIDQKIQEFCVRYATAVIEMARSNKAAAPVLARWEQAKQENETLKQYWDMVTALCLLPLHFGENFVEMVLEIGEDDEVKAQGKIVPTLVARGNIFRTDEFFLIAENTIVQEFEEFTIAFASLYSSYWVFNMVYPETIENTYNYIQRCIVRQREPGAISAVCKNFTKSLQKWNKDKEGK